MSGILLVEDEEAIKRKLMNNVPWRDYGFDPVLGASNGEEAYPSWNSTRSRLW